MTKVAPNFEAERKEIFTYIGMYQPFFAHLLFQQLRWVWTSDYPTAAVDGRHLYMNPEFWAKLKSPERVFLIAHEIMHCVLQHPWRRCDRETLRWNIACDLVINDCLIKSNIGTMPQGGLIANDVTYQNDSSEKVYDRIPPQGGGGGQGQGQQGKGQGQQGKGQGQGQGKGQGGGKGRKGGGSGPVDIPEGCGPLDEVLDGSSGEHDADGEAAGKDWLVAIAAAKETAKMQGNMPGHVEELVNHVLKSRVNWKEKLREWTQIVTRGYDRRGYHKPNRRYASSSVIFPSFYSEQIGTFVVALDTSGSVSANEWALFKGEIMSILEEVKPKKALFIYCDAAVQLVDEITDESSDYVPRFVGRGGTSFIPPFEWLEKHDIIPDAFVYFTDGYGSFPKESAGFPVFWAITNTSIVAPWGVTIPVLIEEAITVQ